MKILILADPSSPHIIKWANAISKQKIQVKLFGLSYYNPKDYEPEIEITVYDKYAEYKEESSGNISKLGYIKALPMLKRLIKSFEPDILHAYYASSYGLMGALTNFKPFVISTWGSDVFDFPRKSFVYTHLLRFILSKAQAILATSPSLENEVKKYTAKQTELISYGVDTEYFKPREKISQNNEIVIGSVKTLDYTYGTDLLIRAFHQIVQEDPTYRLRLLLVGKNRMGTNIFNLLKDLGIENYVELTGYIEPSLIRAYHQKLDIAVYLSRHETFGVSILESASTELPVVASNIEPFKQIIKDGDTGLLCESGNSEAAAIKIMHLIESKNLREKMGKQGREFVLSNYNFKHSFESLITLYKKLI